MKIKAKIYQTASTKKWTLNYIESKENKRIRKSFPSKRSATLFLEGLNSNIIQKIRGRECDKKTVNSIIDEYIVAHPKSNFLKADVYAPQFREEFGEMAPKKITPTLLKDWMIKIGTKYNLKFKILINIKGQFRKIFTYMEKEGYVATNPLKKIIVGGQLDIQIKYKLSQEDMKIIFENLSYESPFTLYRLFYVMYYTGMTKQEIVELKREHLNYMERKINIVSPKAGFVRSITIPAHVAEMLNGQPRKYEYLITGREGNKINYYNLSTYLIRFRSHYPETPKFTAEDIRNAGVFHFLERGGTLRYLSEMLGHSSQDDTAKLYGRHCGRAKNLKLGETATNQKIVAADWDVEVID